MQMVRKGIKRIAAVDGSGGHSVGWNSTAPSRYPGIKRVRSEEGSATVSKPQSEVRASPQNTKSQTSVLMEYLKSRGLLKNWTVQETVEFLRGLPPSDRMKLRRTNEFIRKQKIMEREQTALNNLTVRGLISLLNGMTPADWERLEKTSAFIKSLKNIGGLGTRVSSSVGKRDASIQSADATLLKVLEGLTLEDFMLLRKLRLGRLKSKQQ